MAVSDRVMKAIESVFADFPDLHAPVNVRRIALQYAHVQLDKLPEEVSGVVGPAYPGSSKNWLIIVNKNHSPVRQRFTTAHELGHVFLHQYDRPHADGLPRVHFRDGESSLGVNREEIEANQFAAELLMPAHLLAPKLRQTGLSSWDGGDDSVDVQNAIEDLAHEFKVSKEAMLIRIGTLLQR